MSPTRRRYKSFLIFTGTPGAWQSMPSAPRSLLCRVPCGRKSTSVSGTQLRSTQSPCSSAPVRTPTLPTAHVTSAAPGLSGPGTALSQAYSMSRGEPLKKGQMTLQNIPIALLVAHPENSNFMGAEMSPGNQPTHLQPLTQVPRACLGRSYRLPPE